MAPVFKLLKGFSCSSIVEHLSNSVSSWVKSSAKDGDFRLQYCSWTEVYYFTITYDYSKFLWPSILLLLYPLKVFVMSSQCNSDCTVLNRTARSPSSHGANRLVSPSYSMDFSDFSEFVLFLSKMFLEISFLKLAQLT